MGNRVNTARGGALVLIGGSEDRRGSMRILRRVVDINNAQTVVVIPSASSYPANRIEDYQKAFGTIGVQDLIPLDIRSPSEADSEDNLAAIDRADVVFFTGGDQVKLVDAIAGTRLLAGIRSRFAAGATVAGTSAGAAAASDPMIWDGDGKGFEKGTVRHGPGFGLVESITIDTHFVRRGRISRLAQFLCSGRSSRGLGLGEDTAVVVDRHGVAEVIGRGMVTCLSSEHIDKTSYHEIIEGAQLTMDGLRLGFLAPGTFFDLERWRVADPLGLAEQDRNRRSA